MPTKLPRKYEQLGSRVYLEMQAGLSARESLKERWRALEAMYRNEKDASGNQILDEFETQHIPLIYPVCRRIIDTVHAAITSVSPMCMALDCDHEAGEVTSKQFDVFFGRATGQRTLKRALVPTTVNGIGFLYSMFTAGKGFHLNSIPPNDMIVTPTTVTEIKEAVMVGHRFYVTEQEYKSLVADGTYFNVGDLPIADPDTQESSRSQTFDLTNAAVTTAEIGTVNSTALYELAQIFWFADLSAFDKGLEKGLKWHRITLATDNQSILSCEVWPYSRPPYFDVRLWDEEVKFWPASSVANNLQGLQNIYTNLVNMLAIGTLVSAFPTTVISGGKLTEAVKKTKIGALLEADGPVGVANIQTVFDGSNMPLLIQLIEQITEKIAAIPQTATGEQTPVDQTATATAYLQSMQQQAESSYATMVSYPLEDLFTYWHEVCRMHKASLTEIYKGALLPDFITALDEDPRFEMLGKVATKTPQVQMQMAQMLLQMAQDRRSMLNPQEIIKRMVDMMPLDNTDKLYYEADQLSQGGGDALQPGMGMVQGGASEAEASPLGDALQMQAG